MPPCSLRAASWGNKCPCTWSMAPSIPAVRRGRCGSSAECRQSWSHRLSLRCRACCSQTLAELSPPSRGQRQIVQASRYQESRWSAEHLWISNRFVFSFCIVHTSVPSLRPHPCLWLSTIRWSLPALHGSHTPSYAWDYNSTRSWVW